MDDTDKPELLETVEASAPRPAETVIRPTAKVESQPADGKPGDTGKDAPTSEPAENPTAPPKKTGGLWRRLIERTNVYLLVFVFLLIIAGGAIVVSIFQAHKSATSQSSTDGQQLSSSALQQLSNSDATVGTAQQTLNVQSNAVFAGQVLVRGNLEVAGSIKSGGPLSLPGITVSGNSNLDQTQIGTLAVSGNTAIQGNVTVQHNLTVSGTGSFASLTAQQLSVGTLQLNGDSIFTHHIVAGGAIPGKADGNALGSGGTSSLSGSDTAGTVTLNIGSSPAAGCFAVITFAQKFAGTPRVSLTPSNSAAATVSYYVTRTTNTFSVCTASPAPANQTLSFDYAIFG